jgi:dTDP-4-amino-4,6-dideoxygalactose transaminase
VVSEREARVPLIDLAAQEAAVADDVLRVVASVARQAQFILGPWVEDFERWLAAACEAKHAVGVASGTDALELSLRASGVGQGDAVVTPAVSFVATAEAIANAGARPVFCDVDPATMNLTAATCDEALLRARRAGLRVKAIVPVHLFGRCAPAGELLDLASRERVDVIEDAAQALGARDETGRPAGASGAAGCFSFFPTKNLGAWGDGGALVTSRDDLASRARKLRAHGASEPYVHETLGRNSRLDALQAAVLLAKTPRLGAWQAARARIAARYARELRGLAVDLPADVDAPAVHAWHAYVVTCDRRDAMAAHLKRAGVETRVYYPVPLHRQPCFAGLGEPALPVAERLAATALALPMFSEMTEAQQGRVIEAVRAF